MSVGFESKSIYQFLSYPLILLIINSIDLGIIGDHYLSIRLPFEYIETVNYSMKLLDRPIPTWEYGLESEW